MGLLKVLDLFIAFTGMYIMVVVGFILNLEIECGIESMPYDAMIRIAILALIGLICLVGSFLWWRKLDD